MECSMYTTIKLHEITLQFEGKEYPEPTREQIAEKACEYLNELKFSYSEKRYSDKTEEINTEPVTSDLETFGDIDKAMEKAHQKLDGINPSTARFDEQRHFSSKDVSSSEYSVYSLENDPLNEE